MADEKTWIEDGTPEEEPVTTETPADEVSVGATETTETETPETPEPVSTDEVAAEATEETKETTEKVEEVVQKFIEGKLGDETFQLPEDVLIPQTRDGETEYVPILDVLKRGMFEKDYRTKTAELGDDRRAFEASQASAKVEGAKLEAKEKYLAEREEQVRAALSDPEKAAQYQQHLEMYRDNPMYRETWDKSWANRETEAERDSLRQEKDDRVVQDASKTARGWIETLATEFDGVDPGRVASIYGQRLGSGQASLDISDVRSIYQAEADYLSRASEPLRAENATLSAKNDALTATKAAEEHNEATQHAVDRAKTTPVATGAGAPAKSYTPPGKFGPNELAEKNQEWADVR